MATFICKPDCGNAPKKLLLRDYNEAATQGDLGRVESYLTDDVVWELYEPAGQRLVHGRAAVIAEFRDNLVINPTEVTIVTLITHGNEGAASGTIKTIDKEFVFGEFYLFARAKGGKIKRITTYIIEKIELVDR